MSVKNITGSFLLSLLLLVGCQSGTSEKEASEGETNTEQENTESGSAADAQEVQPMHPGPQLSAEDISDEELEKFATAMNDVQAYSQELRGKMMAALEDEGLDPQRFGQIQQAQQMPDQTLDASAEEMEKFKRAESKIQELQMGAQEAMEQKVTDAGLTVDRYREIMMVAQRDPELQQKINAM